MKHQSPAPQENPNVSKWGYAFAGAIALGFAAVIQFAFGGLSEDALENLPAYIVVPYGIAGKLGITVPLALLGLGLIGRDLLANSNSGQGKPASAAPRRGKAARKGESELEFGEPILDEAAAPAAPIPASKKIPAGPARRGATAAAPQAEGGGQMVLSSAKYMTGGNGTGGSPGNFRKGGTHHTKTEE